MAVLVYTCPQSPVRVRDSACSLADREVVLILFKGTGGSVQIIGMSHSSTFQDAGKDVQTKVM